MSIVAFDGGFPAEATPQGEVAGSTEAEEAEAASAAAGREEEWRRVGRWEACEWCWCCERDLARKDACHATGSIRRTHSPTRMPLPKCPTTCPPPTSPPTFFLLLLTLLPPPTRTPTPPLRRSRTPPR
eukprot:3939741-Rhodomonas_salina.1